MPQLLDRDLYVRVAALTDAVPHYLSAQAVVAGASPGRIWVDDPESPRAALIDAPEGFHLLGDPAQEEFGRRIAEFYVDRIVPAGRHAGWRYSCLHYWPRDWERVIRSVVEPLTPCWGYQHFLLLREPKVDWRALIPDGYEMLPATAELLSNGLRGAEAIEGWGFWSMEDFLQRGFALLLVHEGHIICRCTADMVLEDKTELGIYTHEGYRGRGFATATAAAAVEHCLQRGIGHIGWHCWSPNVASRRTAERVGFEPVLDHHGLELWLEE